MRALAQTQSEEMIETRAALEQASVENEILQAEKQVAMRKQEKRAQHLKERARLAYGLPPVLTPSSPEPLQTPTVAMMASGQQPSPGANSPTKLLPLHSATCAMANAGSTSSTPLPSTAMTLNPATRSTAGSPRSTFGDTRLPPMALAAASLPTHTLASPPPLWADRYCAQPGVISLRERSRLATEPTHLRFAAVQVQKYARRLVQRRRYIEQREAVAYEQWLTFYLSTGRYRLARRLGWPQPRHRLAA